MANRDGESKAREAVGSPGFALEETLLTLGLPPMQFPMGNDLYPFRSLPPPPPNSSRSLPKFQPNNAKNGRSNPPLASPRRSGQAAPRAAATRQSTPSNQEERWALGFRRGGRGEQEQDARTGNRQEEERASERDGKRLLLLKYSPPFLSLPRPVRSFVGSALLQRPREFGEESVGRRRTFFQWNIPFPAFIIVVVVSSELVALCLSFRVLAALTPGFSVSGNLLPTGRDGTWYLQRRRARACRRDDARRDIDGAWCGAPPDGGRSPSSGHPTHVPHLSDPQTLGRLAVAILAKSPPALTAMATATSTCGLDLWVSSTSPEIPSRLGPAPVLPFLI
nr:unnamed protein product [Digitaria exilis]